jgi:hypothetical protein
VSDLNDLERLQSNLQIIAEGKANQYFEDLVFKIINFAKNRMLEGAGSPEGVVEAPRRSQYFDLAGGVGARLYYKTTDTGNTGWVPV